MAPRSRQFIPALRFDSLTRIYDPVVALTTREQGFKRRLLEHARVKDGESVLDLACGTGTLAIAVKMDVPKAKLSAIDADIGSGKMSSSPFSTPSKMACATDRGDAFGMSKPRVMSVSTGPVRTA